MGRSGSKLWKYAAAAGVMGLLMMMAAILVAQSLGEYVWHRGTFGIGVYLDCAADACGCMGTGAVV